ncbi:MAG: feruloyl-CoA synthetase [Rhodobacteraceae bacterium]|jgi:feruloyl-CoA synthase|nr:feruloyl-CoA synthetase [Paracoccaceae bacterium]NCV66839.1 feruloyl-CoA synthetase [Paracoccaceae bacterium]NCX08516.1 feruloyl-CoA synthetase [Paracoccaceae bacterium]NCX19168.1 feruloyl-CoA synthetase [Paracoccaceae bacterium]NDD42490.1 feruloyl-CoA synthetase [Paracoccaceae bacterium]
MKRTSNFKPHDVSSEQRSDETLLLRSNAEMGDVVDTSADWLHRWSVEAPERIFLAERSGAGWREETYQSTLQKVRAIAASLLARGMGPDTPILIMSGNGVDHGVLTLAAHYVGVPTAPIAEQYALIPAARERLEHAISLVKPSMAYVVDADKFAHAITIDALAGVEIVASDVGSQSGVTGMDTLLQGDSGVDIDAARGQVTPDSVVKILMTSGSTSAPKGVMTTQRMMCVNQTQIADSLPFLTERPPSVVDWLPWNHVFGGSHNFNMMLANGGSFYIDDGKPLKGLFDRTVENLKMVTGSLVFNVPVGFGMLLQALKSDQDLRQRFFQDLDMIFYAGASLPQDIWQGLEHMALDVKGEVPLMTSSWGLTETAPATMIQQEPTDRSGVIGVPMSGVTLKLIPEEDGRYEVRAKGPNIMPGYYNDPQKTAEAFDGEGYFITGDAMVFVDPDNVNAGMRFDGRISEDFKLLTGTWVRATALRMSLLSHFAPLAADLVMTGQDKSDIGVLIFPNKEAIETAGHALDDVDGMLSDPSLLTALRDRLAAWNEANASSSTRIARAALFAEPASLVDAEITAKGNLNFRKVLQRRSAILDHLYNGSHDAVIVPKD